MRSDVDSEQYAIALELRSAAEIPADFRLSIPADTFLAGLFVPRDRPDWFGRSAYPARVVILTGDSVSIHAHPKADQSPVRIPLSELAVIELGHFLLQGWVKFIATGSESTVRYSTTNQRLVDGFLMRVRTAWLPPASAAKPCLETNVPELKFQYGLWLEVRLDEQIRCTLFNRAEILKRRTWWRPYIQRHPGDLLALTTRRLLWITDRYQGRSDRYGTLTSYAPISRVAGVCLEKCGNESRLSIEFDARHSWHVPLPVERGDDARQFVEDVRRSIGCKTSPDYRSAG